MIVKGKKIMSTSTTSSSRTTNVLLAAVLLMVTLNQFSLNRMTKSMTNNVNNKNIMNKVRVGNKKKEDTNDINSISITSTTKTTKTTPRKVYVDLGANCGNTYYKHRQEHPDDADEWEVYLWEPSPQMHKFYLDDLQKEYPDVNIIPHAAGIKDGELELFVHRGQEHVTDKSEFLNGGRCTAESLTNPSGGTTIYKDIGRAGESVAVKVVNFPNWLKDLNIRSEDSFIFKIDIEGAEYDILDQLLSDDNSNEICTTDLMKIEFHPKTARKSSQLDSSYETFGDEFPNLFRKKCGRDVNLELLV